MGVSTKNRVKASERWAKSADGIKRKGKVKNLSASMISYAGSRSFIAAVEADDLKLQLLDKLNLALVSYESRRATLLQNAMNEGGIQHVQDLENEYNAAQSAYFELLNRALAANGAQYSILMSQAIQVTQKVKAEIDQLQEIVDIINNLAASVNLIGRIIVLFGI